jgi:hypothetical protein
MDRTWVRMRVKRSGCDAAERWAAVAAVMATPRGRRAGRCRSDDGLRRGSETPELGGRFRPVGGICSVVRISANPTRLRHRRVQPPSPLAVGWRRFDREAATLVENLRLAA